MKYFFIIIIFYDAEDGDGGGEQALCLALIVLGRGLGYWGSAHGPAS